jgi:hypothetical protein
MDNKEIIIGVTKNLLESQLKIEEIKNSLLKRGFDKLNFLRIRNSLPISLDSELNRVRLEHATSDFIIEELKGQLEKLNT